MRSLDALRGYSALVVLLAHFVQIFILPKLGLESYVTKVNATIASLAVMSFFLISGYVIAHSIEKHIKQDRMDVFFINRLARIFPPLIFAVLLTFVLYQIIVLFQFHGYETFRLAGDLYTPREKANFSFENAISSLLLLQGVFPNPFFVDNYAQLKLATNLNMNGPLWSLSFEFWLYFIAGILFLGLYKKWYLLFLLTPFILSIMFFGNVRFVFLGLVWGLGFGIYFFKHRLEKRGILILVLSVIFLGRYFYLDYSFLHALTKGFAYPGGHYVFYLFQASFLLLLFLILRWFIDLKYIKSVGCYLGNFSYTLYIIHFPILLFLFSFLHQYIHRLDISYLVLIGVFLLVLVVFFAKWVAMLVEDKKRFQSWLIRISAR